METLTLLWSVRKRYRRPIVGRNWLRQAGVVPPISHIADKCLQAALRQGNLQVVELAYQKSRQYDKLSLLYLVTGDTAKLSKMLHIAQMREDAQSRFHHSLMLGNVEERVGVLEQTGNSALAYIVAKSHSLSDRADELHAKLEGAEIADVPGASLLLPPMPIALGSNWPRVHVARGYFDGQAGADGRPCLLICRFL